MYKKIIFLIIFIFILFNNITYASTNNLSSSKLTFQINDNNYKDKKWYEIDALPGKEYSFSFNVTNTDSKSISFYIYPTDVITSVGGGASFRSPHTNNQNNGRWFVEKPLSVTLQPSENRSFDFHARLPRNIKSGQYISAIAIEENQKPNSSINNKSTNLQFTYVKQQGIQTVFNVSPNKAIHQLKLIDGIDIFHSDSGLTSFTIYFNNKGTILEHPIGEITLLDNQNNIIDKLNYKMASVYENTVGSQNFVTKQPLNSGQYYLKYNYNTTIEHQNKMIGFVVNENQFIVKKPDFTEPQPKSFKSELLLLIILVILFIILLTFFIKKLFLKPVIKRSNRPYPSIYYRKRSVRK
jgi:hypothetical protein